MNTFIETQLAQIIIPELAQELITEIKKHFDIDSDLNLAIVSWTKNKEGSIKFMIRHRAPKEDSSSRVSYYENLYSLVHKDNLWEMTLVDSSCSYIEYNYYESSLVPKAKEPLQLELFDELSGQEYTALSAFGGNL